MPHTTIIVKVKFLTKNLPSFEKLCTAKNITIIKNRNITILPAVSNALSEVKAKLKSPVAKILKSAMPTEAISIKANVFKNADVSC